MRDFLKITLAFVLFAAALFAVGQVARGEEALRPSVRAALALPFPVAKTPDPFTPANAAECHDAPTLPNGVINDPANPWIWMGDGWYRYTPDQLAPPTYYTAPASGLRFFGRRGGSCGPSG